MKKMNYLKESVTGLCLTLLLSSCSQDKSSSVGSEDGGMVTDSTRIAFFSQASNLMDGVNTDGRYNQVYLKNIVTGEVELVSSNKNGEAASNGAFFVSQSADANKIAFFSGSANLIEGASSDFSSQAFVKNMKTGDVVLVSKNELGEMGNGRYSDFFLKISADGNRVAFMTDATNFGQNSGGQFVTFVKDITSGKIIRLDVTKEGVEGDGGFQSSSNPTFSLDGKKIAFQSNATNLVPNDTNNDWDIFVKDFDTGEITLISADANGIHGDKRSYDGVISPDGTKVVFGSEATNLVPGVNTGSYYIYIKDIATGKIELVSDKLDQGGLPSFSFDSKKLAFHSGNNTLVDNDTNNGDDVFIIDLATKEISLVTTKTDGTQMPGRDTPNAALTFTPDGKNVYFQSPVAFADDDSVSTNAYDDWDIYLKNLVSGELTMISRNAAGVKADSKSRLDGNW